MERNYTTLSLHTTTPYISIIIILLKSILSESSLCLLGLLPPLFSPACSPPSLLFTPFLLSPPVNPVFDRVSPEFPANNALALVIARHTCIGTEVREARVHTRNAGVSFECWNRRSPFRRSKIVYKWEKERGGRGGGQRGGRRRRLPRRGK